MTPIVGVDKDHQIERVQVGDLAIEFHRSGAGDPVVFVHGGFGMDHRSWAPQLESFADDFTVVAWDGPGTGASSDPPAEFRMPDFADCLAGMLTAAGIAGAHIVGMSAGSTVALELYFRHPDLTRSLVLAGAYAGWAGSLPKEEVDQRLAAYLAQVERPPAEWVPNYLPTMITDEAPDDVRARVLALLGDIRPKSSAVLLQSMADCDQRGLLASIAVPTLLVYGEFDVRSPVSVGEDLHARIPASELVVLPGVGHVCNLEAPAAFDAAVRAFLARVP